MTEVEIYPDQDFPGNDWKVVLPDGETFYFDTKDKAKKFVELYRQSLKSPEQRKVDRL